MEQNTNHTVSKMSNFYTRTISTMFILPPVLYSVWEGGLLYFLLIFLVLVIAGYEFANICGRWSFSFDGMIMTTFMMLSATSFFLGKVVWGAVFIFLTVYLTYMVASMRYKSEKIPVVPSHLKRTKWLTLGSLYLSLGFSSMMYLAHVDETGVTILWVFLATVCNDVFAYIFGSLIGGKKIAPSISPNKSWSGFIAAAISTMVLTYLFGMYVNSSSEILLLSVGLLLAVFAHMGDMIESAFKRYLGIKDTSNIIPGHGGILDRIDAVLMVAFVVAVLGLILGKSPLFF